MYLTQMPLNPQRRSTRDLIVSPQRLHAAVLAGFLPGASERGRVLWRLDADGPHELNLYVVSAEPPSFEALVDDGPFLSRLEPGQRWVFRLVANPVRNVRDAPSSGDRGASRQRGRRVPLIKEPDQREWLLSRSGRLGFRVADGAAGGANLSVTRGQRRRFDRRKEDETWSVTLQTAQFDGVLEIVDVDAFRRTLSEGAGGGKGYGCGLMTLASEP